MRPDFTKMSTEEVRQLYCDITKKPRDEADSRKKSSLVEELLQYYEKPQEISVAIDKPFEETEVELEEEHPPTYERAQLEQIDKEGTPIRGSKGWQEYVLSLLSDNEYADVDGNRFPKTPGLRRLVEVLLGPIVYSGPAIFHQKDDVTTVSYVVKIDWKHSGDIREFAEIADVCPLNTPPEFYRHAAATACSRAAGRAFRNALLLSIHTAEEMTAPATNGPADDIRLLDMTATITGSQVAGIKHMCNKLGIDLDKLLTHNAITEEVEKILKVQGQDLLLQLNKYGGSGPDILAIPDTILKEKVS